MKEGDGKKNKKGRRIDEDWKKTEKIEKWWEGNGNTQMDGSKMKLRRNSN